MLRSGTMLDTRRRHHCSQLRSPYRQSVTNWERQAGNLSGSASCARWRASDQTLVNALRGNDSLPLTLGQPADTDAGRNPVVLQAKIDAMLDRVTDQVLTRGAAVPGQVDGNTAELVTEPIPSLL